MVGGCIGYSKMHSQAVPTLDYSVQENWAVTPEKVDKDVDVFFIAPTTTKDPAMNMNVKDPEARKKFLGATMMEKGIYDDKTNFYAPYYEQMTMEAYNLDEKGREQYFEKAYADVDAAFNYYMEHYNNGKPIVLAGFSQGGEILKMLLIHHPEIQDKLVAAYVIGWNITDEDLAKYPQLKMAQGEKDTGVIVSFCSENEDIHESIIVPETTNGINPLNWKTDGTVATKEENLGACFTDYSGKIKKEVPQLCGAHLDENRGTLKVSDVTPEEYPARLDFLKDGNYHIYDYQFFYRNLEKNVQTRIQSYFETHMN
ncbi:MAG: DUF3089 domain-containing protein [Firmicutes bacterium]|nr:DUF3089 domain-containing protein [Bacillota bacterium]